MQMARSPAKMKLSKLACPIVFALLILGLPSIAPAHDGQSIIYAARRPSLEPPEGPGLIHAAITAVDAANDANAGTAPAIAARTGIAANVIVRSRLVRLDPSVLAGLVPASIPLVQKKAAIAGAPIRLALFGDADFWVSPVSIDRSMQGYVIWNGVVIDHPQSSVSLIQYGDRLIGDVFVDGHAYKIRPSAAKTTDPIYEIVDVDENAYRHGPVARVEDSLSHALDPNPATARSFVQSSPLKNSQTAALASTPVSIPVIFAYSAKTASLAAQLGQDIRAQLLDAANVVNTVWANSGVNAVLVPTIMAADASLVDVPELLAAHHLDYLSGYYVPANDAYAKLRQARDRQGAALLQLIVVGTDTDTCGMAWQPDRPYGIFAQAQGFSVVGYDCLGTINAHEIGHNLGLSHNRATDNITEQAAYNVGWIDTQALIRDVMSYPNPCPNCIQQRLYSSPLLTVKGRSFGRAAGSTDPSDGVRAVNEDIPAVAAFRPNPVKTPDANQFEYAITLGDQTPAGTAPIALARPTFMCTAQNDGDGAVWFKHVPAVTGIATFAISDLAGNDRSCLFSGAPTGIVKPTPTGAYSPNYHPSMLLSTNNPQGLVQIAVPAIAGQPIYLALNGAAGSDAKPVSVKASTAVPQTGWWYDANYIGMGFALETAPPDDGSTSPRVFLAGFFYRDDGTPNWGIAIGAMSDPATFTGDLLAVKGGRPFGTTGTSTSLDGSLGKVSLVFSSPTTGKLTWPGGTLNLQRYIFDTNPIDYTVSGTLDSGWYWVPNDPGRGLFIEQQGSSLFAATFQYDAKGVATWQVASASKISTGLWQGDLIDSQGGTTPVSSFRKSSLRTNFGTMRFATLYPAKGYYLPLTNPGAPVSFPYVYYSTNYLQIQLPGIATPLSIERFRF
jgi:hypothetical protein